ncbi:Uncharacterised protein [Neisseria meningitidis]|nr:Uncharacterised protein [Neisseria meningitidis]
MKPGFFGHIFLTVLSIAYPALSKTVQMASLYLNSYYINQDKATKPQIVR